ncbi:plasma membrane calcium-transporting atpase, partial [Reticulomyxa filosa]
MVYDKNFVRHIDACETMGNATTICSDKTGTLTQNSMKVTRVFIGGTKYFSETPSKESLGAPLFDLVTRAIICNSKAFYDEKEEEEKENTKLVGGNQTECALLQWALDLGAKNYKEIRTEFPVTKFFPFDSAIKSSSVLVKGKEPDQYFVFTKGAAEQVIDCCSHY